MITYSIIQKSQLEGSFRLDAEYYQPEYLYTQRILLKFKPVLLKDVAIITTGPAYSSEGIGVGFDIPLARIGDVVNKTATHAWLKLTSKEFDKFHGKKIKDGDILMSMTGDPPDVGKCNFISVTNSKIITFNQRVAKITAKISPYYLFAYLSTEIARLQAERNALGIRQRNLGIEDLKNTLIVLPDQKHQELISGLIEDYLSKLENSRSLYSQAENLFLEELGLKNFESEKESWSVVKLSETKKIGRIDAEYFQPKYQKLFSGLQKYNVRTLSELATIKKGFEPGSEAYQDEGKLFIRVSSISKDGITDKDQKYLRDDLYKKLKNDYEPKVGEILLTKDASPGMAYVVKESIDGIISGGVLRIKLKEDIEAEYLALVINSIVGQSQVERDAGGSIIAHWRPEQVKALQIPILPKSTQQKISELVKKSHESRKMAKDLLESAKRKVEELIEKGDIV